MIWVIKKSSWIFKLIRHVVLTLILAICFFENSFSISSISLFLFYYLLMEIVFWLNLIYCTWLLKRSNDSKISCPSFHMIWKLVDINNFNIKTFKDPHFGVPLPAVKEKKIFCARFYREMFDLILCNFTYAFTSGSEY